MSDDIIELKAEGDRGRYFMRLDDGSEAEMTYRLQGENIMAIDHTFVPPHHRGGGIAERLVKRGIEDARANDQKIDPVCPYVAVQFRRHPEWRDLLA